MPTCERHHWHTYYRYYGATEHTERQVCCHCKERREIVDTPDHRKCGQHVPDSYSGYTYISEI